MSLFDDAIFDCNIFDCEAAVEAVERGKQLLRRKRRLPIKTDLLLTAPLEVARYRFSGEALATLALKHVLQVYPCVKEVLRMQLTSSVVVQSHSVHGVVLRPEEHKQLVTGLLAGPVAKQYLRLLLGAKGELAQRHIIKGFVGGSLERKLAACVHAYMKLNEEERIKLLNAIENNDLEYLALFLKGSPEMKCKWKKYLETRDD